MRATTVAAVSSAVGVVLLLSVKPHHVAVASAMPDTTGPNGGTTATPQPGTSAAPASGGTSYGTRTGTFTGDTVNTRYGPVQVAVTLADGRLTGVQVLQVPSENGRDRSISASAVPELTKEALAAQNAQIDTVSGATYTSKGYIRSLQSALDQAHG
ncbi:MAG: FMN-binding protein [Streptomycetaceae bacterium]|nr:FMN-binding protein [Streptomycetaceae bacterium]